jgi:NADPH:quinone reductase-like Zn-dependent oxidoreductase
LGADEVINCTSDINWSEQVKEFTKGLGATRVIETGGIDTFEQSVKATAFNGEITLVSSAGIVNHSQISLQSILMPLFVKLVTIRPIFVGNRRSFEEMNRAIETYDIKPVIDKIFEFKKAKKAYEYLATGENIGKVVIKLAH